MLIIYKKYIVLHSILKTMLTFAKKNHYICNKKRKKASKTY